MKHKSLVLFALLLAATPALGETPTINAVTANQQGTDWRFDVTLTHPDVGWEHYADGWEVVDGSGNVLGHRTLAHPHGFNQPFTRSLAGVSVPEGVEVVYLRAHCLVDGWGEDLFRVELGQ